MTTKSDQQGDRIGVALIASTKILTTEMARALVDDLVYIVGKLVTAMEKPLVPPADDYGLRALALINSSVPNGH